MAIWSVVLAAGEGRRMGGTKGLVELRGRPLLEHVLGAVRQSTVSGAIVVVGADADAVTPVAEAAGGIVVENPDWRSGQTSSIRSGLAALPDDADGFLIHPVDHALVTTDDLDALMDAWAATPAPEREQMILRPVCDGAWGHPVLFARHYADAFLALAPDEPGHTVYRAHRDRVSAVPVSNPNIATDLDTPDDLADHE